MPRPLPQHAKEDTLSCCSGLRSTAAVSKTLRTILRTILSIKRMRKRKREAITSPSADYDYSEDQKEEEEDDDDGCDY
jgi:hypothetical protein